MAYTIIEAAAGYLPIANTDAGVLTASSVSAGTTTTIPSPPMYLGMVVKATDPTYGLGEFILLAGCASTVVGSLVVWAGVTASAAYATTLALGATHKNSGAPLAVAMSANTSTTTFGWYQISGNTVVKKTAVAVTPNVPIMLSATGGRVKVLTSAGFQIVGCRSANTTTVTSTTSTVIVTIERPCCQTQIT